MLPRSTEGWLCGSCLQWELLEVEDLKGGEKNISM